LQRVFSSAAIQLVQTALVSDSRPSLTSLARDFDGIEAAGHVARDAVWAQDIRLLAQAVSMSYAVQQAEGMAPLPSDVPGALAYKYCGGGFGGMLSPGLQHIPSPDIEF
jgi:hypothetical protein